MSNRSPNERPVFLKARSMEALVKKCEELNLIQGYPNHYFDFLEASGTFYCLYYSEDKRFKARRLLNDIPKE